MRRTILASAVAALASLSAGHAAIVNFSYTQSDSTTGSGSIAPFTFMGHDFLATPLSATVFNPGGAALTPAGFVGAITTQAGTGNENNAAVGLLFSGVVTATSTDGFQIDIPLVFVAKQIQTPTDLNDYTWSVAYGDSIANGVDAVSTGSPAMRFAMYFSRDDVLDSTDTANKFQRYTQGTNTFVAGADSFTNTDTSVSAIKDAVDSGTPLGTDAAGRDLAFYFGWRDQGTLTTGPVLVDEFTVGGLLEANESTLRAVPEPSTGLMLLAGSLVLMRRRRR